MMFRKHGGRERNAWEGKKRRRRSFPQRRPLTDPSSVKLSRQRGINGDLSREGRRDNNTLAPIQKEVLPLGTGNGERKGEKDVQGGIWQEGEAAILPLLPRTENKKKKKLRNSKKEKKKSGRRRDSICFGCEENGGGEKPGGENLQRESLRRAGNGLPLPRVIMEREAESKKKEALGEERRGKL